MTINRNRYAALDRAVDREDCKAVIAAMAKLTEHEKDLIVDCPVRACRVPTREECVGFDIVEDDKVHFGRRMTRLMKGIR